MQTSNTSNSHDIESHRQGLVKKATSIVSNEFNSFITDIENLFKATTSLSGEDLAKAKERLYARIESAKISAGNVTESISRQTRKTAELTNTYVHEKPWNAIGTGMAISFLAGYLISKRTKV